MTRPWRCTAARVAVPALALVTLAACGSSSHSGGAFSTAPAGTAPASTAAVTSAAPGATATTPAPAPSPAASTGPTPIDHVFIIFKENHTFDNYFGSYPGANGAMSAKTSTGTTVPLTPQVTVFDYPGSNGFDTAHSDYHGGAMDQFDANEGGSIYGISFFSHGPFETYAPASGTPGGVVQDYWQLAQEGTLCDNYFTSVMGCSSPNHMFSFAAQCGNLISNEDLTTHLWTVLDANGNQVTHPNHFSAQEVPTSIANELEAAGLSWKYFNENQGFGTIGQLIATAEDNDASIRGLDVVAALPDFATRFDNTTATLDTNLAALLAQGNVGNVTWIKPAPLVCEHPAIGDVTLGVDWTRKVVNEIGNSQYLGPLRDPHHVGRLRRLLRPRRPAPGRSAGPRLPRAVHRRQPVRQEGLRRPHPVRALLARASSPRPSSGSRP